MPGDFGSPYRPPTGGWPSTRVWAFGGLYQHFDPAENGLTKLDNVTVYTSINGGCDPSNVVPNVTPSQRLFADGEEGGTWTCSGTGGTNCSSVTGYTKPPRAFGRYLTYEVPTGGTAGNQFTASEDTLDLAHCHKIGQKRVQAQRYRVGRPGFLSVDKGHCAVEVPTPIQPADLTLGAVDDVFYRTLRAQATFEFEERPYGQFRDGVQLVCGFTVALDITWTVDRYSGVISCSRSVSYSSGPTGYDSGYSAPSSVEVAAAPLIGGTWNSVTYPGIINTLKGQVASKALSAMWADAIAFGMSPGYEPIALGAGSTLTANYNLRYYSVECVNHELVLTPSPPYDPGKTPEENWNLKNPWALRYPEGYADPCNATASYAASASQTITALQHWHAGQWATCDYDTTDPWNFDAHFTGNFLSDEIDFDCDAGTFWHKKWNVITGSGTVSKGDLIFNEECAFTGTTCNYSLSKIAPAVPVWTISCDLTLSDAHSAADVKTELIALLAYWPLNDDVLFPWQTDEFLSCAPLMFYRQVPANVSPADGSCASGWSDGNASTFDGAVLGAPLTAGHYGFFDYGHETWQICSQEVGGGVTIHPTWVNGWGQWNLNAPGVPYRATQWRDNRQSYPGAQYLPGHGAWISQAGDLVVMQKTAETLVNLPSFEYGRPWGVDRTLVDQTQTFIIAATGGTSYDSGTHEALIEIDSGTLPAAWGTGNVVAIVNSPNGIPNGTYTVSTRIDATHCLCSGPRRWPVSIWTTEARIGEVRFPSCPAIAGRVKITAAAQTAPGDVTVTVAEPIYLASVDDASDPSPVTSYENVTISGAVGMTAINGTHRAQPVFSGGVQVFTQFKLSLTAAGTYAGGGLAITPGSPAYGWHDTNPKGDFVTIRWDCSRRDVAEWTRAKAVYDAGNHFQPLPSGSAAPRATQFALGMRQDIHTLTATQDGLAFTTLAPSVVAFTPNGETWPTGQPSRVIAFPDVTLDSRYSSPGARFGSVLWQGVVVQAFQDPLWQYPVKPDDCYCGWTEDDGSGHADAVDCDENPSATKYYPQRPWVEARCTAPVLADSTACPSFWTAGAYAIHILSQTEADSGSPPDGKIINPPSELNAAEDMVDLTALGSWVVWGMWLREQANVCGTTPGRWSTLYAAQQLLTC